MRYPFWLALAPGYNDLREVIRRLDKPDIEVLAIDETRAWEGVEYARDAVTAGRNKALIILGMFLRKKAA